ncbi:hypothetical protein NDU88_003583 [Pleurodeles waltl]|uniref:Uncharacterized protein n=1 Tax=Pleurodeles waltl TaxID=8319 RepID=A0AAV7SGC6_PLEWA|nr:hypothetical protein NDU88_003583 [Pleurodeles waltl]
MEEPAQGECEDGSSARRPGQPIHTRQSHHVPGGAWLNEVWWMSTRLVPEDTGKEKIAGSGVVDVHTSCPRGYRKRKNSRSRFQVSSLLKGETKEIRLSIFERLVKRTILEERRGALKTDATRRHQWTSMTEEVQESKDTDNRKSSMGAVAMSQLPPFLNDLGEPHLPWEQWIKLFEWYLIAIGGEKLSLVSKQHILLHNLGIEGRN